MRMRRVRVYVWLSSALLLAFVTLATIQERQMHKKVPSANVDVVPQDTIGR